MFEPITSQDKFNEMISARLDRERKKMNRLHAEDLSGLIDLTDSLSKLLKELQKKLYDES